VRWLAKAAVQKTIGYLPRSERVNYVFQRRVLRNLPSDDAAFGRKVERAEQHLEALERHGPARPREELVFYEFGAGWDLIIPLTYFKQGVRRQVLVDIRPSVRLELVADSARRLRLPQPRDLSELGIEYLAPRDARETGLPAASVDFISSTDTCEHIPEADLRRIFAECRRLLRTDGVFSCRIDMQDHYSYFDSSVSRYNFLRFSERTWRLVNSPIHFQNRLRRTDYLRLLDEAELDVVEERPSRPTEEDLETLRRLELAPEFRNGYPLEELGVKTLVFVARPRPSSTASSGESSAPRL
jgi:SAM-dependent methyltransferase